MSDHVGRTFIVDEYLCLDRIYVRDNFIYRVAATRLDDPGAGTTSCDGTEWDALSEPLWITTQGLEDEQTPVIEVVPPGSWPVTDNWTTWGEDTDLSELELLVENLREYGVEVQLYDPDWSDIVIEVTDDNGMTKQVALGEWTLQELQSLEVAVTAIARAFFQNTTHDTSDPEVTEQDVFKAVMGLTRDEDAAIVIYLLFVQSSEQHGYCQTYIGENAIVCWGDIIPTVPIVADTQKVYLPQHVQQVNDQPDASQYIFVHEIGHAFDNRSGVDDGTHLREYIAYTGLEVNPETNNVDPIKDDRGWVMANIILVQHRTSYVDKIG